MSWTNCISENRITNIDELRVEISHAEYEGDEPIDPYDDVLFPMGYNTCDRCGDIEDSEVGYEIIKAKDAADYQEFAVVGGYDE